MELKHIKLKEAEAEKALLIVPYGIETTERGSRLYGIFLLIVPYGIETEQRICKQGVGRAFNRTLWN